jgi:mono/diheme cytochrome c family protein
MFLLLPTRWSILAGKKVYVQLCVVCHGDKGKGDGIAGVNLSPRPADHSLAKFQKQTDGAIFWKISTGKAPMASYEKILTVTQRWQVINYLRTLSSVKPS